MMNSACACSPPSFCNADCQFACDVECKYRSGQLSLKQKQSVLLLLKLNPVPPTQNYQFALQKMISSFRYIHPIVHPTSFIEASAQVIGDVHIGEDSSVWFNTVVRGDMHFIRIGDRTNVQDNSVIHVRSDTCPTILEDEVTVGHSVTLHGCHVERGALIGI